MIALGDARDARADLLDDARALVAADDREARHDVAVAQVLVGVAEARRLPADQDLALFRLVEIEVDDLPVATRLPQHRCPGLHEALLLVMPTGAMLLVESFPVRCNRAAGRERGQRLAAEAFARPV